MTDKLSDYGWGFQVKVLAAMFTDRLFLQQISDIIRAEYFESDANSWLLDIILTHFREYKTPPSKDVLKVKITEIENDILKATVLEQLKDVFRYMESDDLTFVKDEILKFCKNQEIKQAIMDSVSLLKHGNFDEIKSKIDSAMKAGADFIKTSTGKVAPAATLPVTLVMLEAVRDYYTQTNVRIGVKAAGGIKTSKDAIKYLVVVNETVGDAWLTPDLFRFGASTLLNDLLQQRQKMLSGHYSGPDYVTID